MTEIESIIDGDRSTPGVHALVIGVSHYPYVEGGSMMTDLGQSFNIGQLTSAAYSASLFSEWLLENGSSLAKPLRSLYVLLSPSPNESIAGATQSKLKGDYSATRKNVEYCAKKIRDESNDPENVIIVYVAGHGVQLTTLGAILLLEDFAIDTEESRDRSLYGAIDIQSFHSSLNNPRRSKSQFWFVDTCRHLPEVASRFNSMEGSIKFDAVVGQTESSPIFMATTPRESAFGVINGASLFCEALLWVLRNTGTTGRLVPNRKWYVSTSVFLQFLISKVDGLAGKHGQSQRVTIDGTINESLFFVRDAPPDVELTLNLNPFTAAESSPATLIHKLQKVVFQDNCTWPIKVKVKAGIYTIKVNPQSDFLPFVDQFPVASPYDDFLVELENNE